MDSDRFDRWTKLFARRMSRRAAAGAMGAMTAAAFAHNAVLAETCEPITRCKIDNLAWCEDVGPIPGGPSHSSGSGFPSLVALLTAT